MNIKLNGGANYSDMARDHAFSHF
ncbi:uncharacterized protein METZ01_LOCUS464130, partial [marine metagenome]